MIIPKGKLIPVGGAEDKGTDLEKGLIQRNNLIFFEQGILRRIVDETHHKQLSKIEVITTASTIPVEVGENYLSAFSKLSCPNVQVMNIRNREDCLKEEYIQRIKDATNYMFRRNRNFRYSSKSLFKRRWVSNCRNKCRSNGDE
jgi:cyanophycinase